MPFDNRGLKAIGTLPAAETLRLEGTAITDRGLAHLADLVSLEHLDLDRNALSDAGLLHLSGLTGEQAGRLLYGATRPGQPITGATNQ